MNDCKIVIMIIINLDGNTHTSNVEIQSSNHWLRLWKNSPKLKKRKNRQPFCERKWKQNLNQCTTQTQYEPEMFNLFYYFVPTCTCN